VSGKHAACRILAIVAVLFAVIQQLLHDHYYHRKYGPLDTISRLSLCAVIFAFVELVKVIGCRMLSLRALSDTVFVKLRARAHLRKLLPCLFLGVSPLVVAAPTQAAGWHHAHPWPAATKTFHKAGGILSNFVVLAPGQLALMSTNMLNVCFALQETIKKEQGLHKVISKVPVEASAAGSARYAAIASAMRVPVWTVGLYLTRLRSYALSMGSRQLSLTAQITRLIRQARPCVAA
jgi:hypothetical protein